MTSLWAQRQKKLEIREGLKNMCDVIYRWALIDNLLRHFLPRLLRFSSNVRWLSVWRGQHTKKWDPGKEWITAVVNFTNILCAAFTCADLKSAKRQSTKAALCALLGSACIKAVHKLVDEIDPGSTNLHKSHSIIHAHFIVVASLFVHLIEVWQNQAQSSDSTLIFSNLQIYKVKS